MAEVVADARRVHERVRDVVLLDDATEEVRHRAARVHRHVLAAVRLVVQRHRRVLREVDRRCDRDSFSKIYPSDQTANYKRLAAAVASTQT